MVTCVVMSNNKKKVFGQELRTPPPLDIVIPVVVMVEVLVVVPQQ